MTEWAHGGTIRWSVAQIIYGNWCVAVVNPNCHARAEGELVRMGYRTFTPRLRKWVSHARVKKAVKRPLLGRYLFVDLPPDAGTERARQANGVEGFVSVAGAPITLPKGCVEDLMRREMEGEWDYVAKEELPIGARVRIMEGEFADMLATLINQRKGKCAVKLLGKNIIKTVYPVNLRAA